MSSQTVEFEEIADDRYGGKAAGLARLRRLGLRVPPGYVIAGVSGVSDAATARFDEMAAAGWTPVAVRSSAVGEDGDDQSFAGQYDTVLGVDTVDRFVDAVRACADSVHSLRASSYSGNASATMNVVVQRMVDARAAGVVFTADPVSGRRDLTVIDVVSGLGEALVDGTVAPDHVVLDADGTAVVNETVAAPVLSPVEIAAIQSGARRAEQEWGQPMDLEWAIDKSGELWWLQARPITTLPGDLNEMDSPVAGADHVYTRCNIGEMMPGAFCPLTASVSGFAIDYAMQMVQVVARAQERYEKPWLQVGYFYGHMFLNLTEGTALSSGILGNSLEQFSTSICGRVIDELEPKPPQPFRRKLGNTVRLTSHALSVGPAIRRLPGEIAGFAVPTSRDPRIVWQELEAGVAQYCDVTLIHVRSSSRAAVAANVLESVLVRRAEKDGRTEDDGKAEAARLMAGASEVESALMLAELDAVVRTIAADSAVAEEFLSAAPDVAVAGLRSASGDAGRALQRFLERHGHRGYRELCMRDPSWADDPGGLGAMMQVMLRSALDPAVRNSAPAAGDETPPAAIRLLARLAQGGARGREETKSRMALMAHRLKRGYRHLGEVLAETGRLPDADLVFFFDRAELHRVVGAGDITDLVESAQMRREALSYQDRLEFDDVSVGRPSPRVVAPERNVGDGRIVGRPAGRGTVEGAVRVAKSIVEARDVQRGEILVAPVTDVGWTPYFTVIGALVTDIGSSVSHGAVVAREYGLPCVVNTLVGTQVLRTGERVRVDGDRGIVERLEAS
ncbi:MULTISPECIES: PEP/pyruvate-binding domain-containing protein [unclassified Gordonia (in: high G+C Gram-positive bacteria)]|uniref:PEP/pyruvate-binding domain-containing protein n=1 Tax=unclassified Gordonia (in: high G+C Gram-positive bacteria) TaxID=2657482 RepID=UPI001965B49B|nr:MULTISPECIES: PEP/pyruvate-binding domain-containing protein [unclassified Gordonia (in: high G+C Gram-positive bacteria)]MBN0972359.1 pyruvate, water dikinase [Gordonia sp. BP-119]MBN0982465.1 pyruvate, water dikinase [Gordonia sp. BP-94]WGJ85176.1 PEP/pyruvate-binding domain-containing protein [Gordonia sp. SMJS1]